MKGELAYLLAAPQVISPHLIRATITRKSSSTPPHMLLSGVFLKVLQRPLPVEMLEEVTLMGLVPGNLVGGNRAEVEALDMG